MFFNWLINWRIIALQYDGFCHTIMQMSHNYIYICMCKCTHTYPTLLSFLHPSHPTPLGHHKIPGWAPCYNAAYHHLPISHMSIQGFPDGTSGKEPASQCRRWQVQSLGQEGALEEGIATCSWYPMDIRAWGRGAHRVWHDWSNLACVKSIYVNVVSSILPTLSPPLCPHVLLKMQFESMLNATDALRTHAYSVAQSHLTYCDPVDCSLCYASLSMEFSRQNTGVDCHFLLQRIFLTQGLKPCLLRW